MSSSSGNDLACLYPFLAGDKPPGADFPAADRLRDQVRDSSLAKIGEVVELRRRVARADAARLAGCADDIAGRLAAGGRLFAFGNGGSSTDAQDLARLFVWPGHGRRAWPAIALTNDVAAVTALTNDIGFDVAFARQLVAFGRPGDVAVGLSTSGNSDNLLRAFDQAKRIGMCTVGLAGGGGGKMAELSSIDHLLVTPSASVHRTQETQTTLYHVLWELATDGLAERTARPSGACVPGSPGPGAELT